MKHSTRQLYRHLFIFILTLTALVPDLAFSYVTRYALGYTDNQHVIANPQDPHERFNRAMFGFNDVIDRVVMVPVATFYNKIIPKPLNAGIHNFYNNIGELPVIANDILQAHFYQMTNDVWRLGVNTTVGIGGLFDVATRMQLPYYTNDFGLTLNRWGYKKTTYLVLPLFGPYTVRDSIGIPVDYYGFAIYPYIYPWATRTAIYGVGVIDKRAQLLKFQGIMEEAAVDKYAFVRSAYMQRRAYQISENERLGIISPATE